MIFTSDSRFAIHCSLIPRRLVQTSDNGGRDGRGNAAGEKEVIIPSVFAHNGSRIIMWR